ncbi:hypothetical protein EX895_006471 [Sporisorium graminicola]|uniref:Glutamine amidotransferase type-2 domain-containing protein n=1 Tax=Sporisorium graminicola TaxID=280036 RepID=A0A4V6YEK5_9BASI|nr:hypothetical protein EX895_006471 [Sporisorium graminicola]TKY84569.1 hypothetical protein EX895_006471 [Sporisorium graminicola]
MCGIGVLIAPALTQQDKRDEAKPEHVSSSLHSCWPSVLENIRHRGPDCLNTFHHDFFAATEPWTVSLTSSVLSLRGDGITAQPLCSKDGRLLLAWNGQIFAWDDQQTSSDRASSSRHRLDSGENDAIILLDRIQQLLDQHIQDRTDDACQQALCSALAEVEGPYAFVLLDRAQSKLYFGRDPLGRRSLLLHQSGDHSALAIVSVASEDMLCCGVSPSPIEIDCSSLWSIDLLNVPASPQPLPRLKSRFTAPLLLQELREDSTQPTRPDRSYEQIRQGLLAVLSETVRRRVTNINTTQPADEAHVAILFSGGLDCTTLALLADRYVPPEQPIDLLNVGFENVRAIAAAKLEREKRLSAKVRSASKGKGKGKDRQTGEAPSDTMVTDPQHASEPMKSTGVEADTDSTTDDIYAVPDRLTGLASYAELRRLSPSRRWNFVHINVPYSEYTSHRPYISTLMTPTSSVMDLSISSALYFASRARGHLLDPTSLAPVAYNSPAKVLISGLGADELLGGYSRHRQAFSRCALPGLVDELQLDLDRLPTRNLGRDDRVLSSHGKEARYPYLDRAVLDFLTAIPVDAKVDLSRIATEGAGGDKRLLRDVALSLGLEGASELKKRAMQFGTRAAKIDHESRNVKGHHQLT